MSDTITGSVYQAPGGGNALLSGVTNSGTVFGSVADDGFIATATTTTLVTLPGYSNVEILGLNASGTTGYGEAATGALSYPPTYFVDQAGALTILPAGEVPKGVDDRGDVLIDTPGPTTSSGSSFLLNDGVATPITVPGTEVQATTISPSGVLAGIVSGMFGIGNYFVETASGATVYDYPFTGQLGNEPPTAVNNAGEVGLTAAGFGYATAVLNGVVVESYQDPFGHPVIDGINAAGDLVIADGIRNDVFIPGEGDLPVTLQNSGLFEVLGINDAGVVVGTVTTTSAAGSQGFIAELPCFAEGTLIAAAAGDVAVEDVRAGDRVRTAGGAWRTVKWTGGRAVNLLSHPDPERARPIVIRADAFGPGLPRRHLRVSPDHAIAFADVLIPAKCLVNGLTVLPDAEATAVTYHHLELDTHDLLLAEGLAAESYLDTGNRASLMDGAGEDADFSSSVDVAWFDWEARGCRRLVLVGAELDRARAHLLARAARPGQSSGVRDEAAQEAVFA